MPSTVAPASGARPSDCSAERVLRVGPSLTPPTLSPQAVEGAFTGLASARVRSPAIPGIRGTSAFSTAGFDSFESLVPGTDDPSAPFGSTVVARLRELFALLVPTPVAAPRRLLRAYPALYVSLLRRYRRRGLEEPASEDVPRSAEAHLTGLILLLTRPGPGAGSGGRGSRLSFG
jgi:hypothetical protein